MKKTILALAAALVAGSALATGSTAPATGTSYTGAVTVSGPINNSISTSASVNGVGSSFSVAGMTSQSRALASITTPVTTTADGTTTIAGSIRGETYTLNNGFVYNLSTGAGTGAASARGGAVAAAGGRLTMNALNRDPAEGTLTLTGSGLSSSAVQIATSGVNSGGYAGVESGSTFDAQGSLALTVNVTPARATIGGEVKDVKNATSFVNTAAGAINFEGGAPEGFTTVAPTVLTGNASSIVNAVGSFSGFKDISGSRGGTGSNGKPRKPN